jgi:hypothetical protein
MMLCSLIEVYCHFKGMLVNFHRLLRTTFRRNNAILKSSVKVCSVNVSHFMDYIHCLSRHLHSQTFTDGELSNAHNFYIHIYIHACIHAHTHAYTHARVRTHIYKYKYIYIYTHIHTMQRMYFICISMQYYDLLTLLFVEHKQKLKKICYKT